MFDTAILMRRAVVAGNTETVRTYLEAGVPVDAPCERGYTALHHAAWYGHTDILHLLLDHGANVHARNVATATPLCHAVERGQTDAVKLLLQSGADPNERYGSEATPLILSTRSVAVVSLLLDAGVDINAVNVVNSTALLYAMIEYNLACVMLLVEHGATVYMPTAKKEVFLLTVRARRGDELSRIIEQVAPEVYAELVRC